jgi:hypothetical protein
MRDGRVVLMLGSVGVRVCVMRMNGGEHPVERQRCPINLRESMPGRKGGNAHTHQPNEY